MSKEGKPDNEKLTNEEKTKLLKKNAEIKGKEEIHDSESKKAIEEGETECGKMEGETNKSGGGGGDDKGGAGDGKRTLEEVSTFEDLLEVVVGTKGRWNLLLFILCGYATFVSPFQALSYQFLGATPEYWCHVDPLVQANWSTDQILQYAIPYSNDSQSYDGCHTYDLNYTAAAMMGYEEALNNRLSPLPQAIPCTHRDFDRSVYQSTVTIEWDLVCGRRALYSTTQSSQAIGGLVGYFIQGALLDAFGRRPVVLWCCLGKVVAEFCLSIMPNIWLFFMTKFSETLCGSGVYLGCFITLMETCSVKDRSVTGTMFVVPWALGYMVLPGVAYWVRSWRWLQVALSLPSLLLMVYFWLLPESPRWLILHSRHNEALEVLRKGAAMNGRSLPPDHHMLAAMGRITKKDVDEKQIRIRELAKRMLMLVRVRELRYIAFNVFYCWFASALVYYGVSLNATNLSTNVYLYIFLGGLLEIPAYLLLWPSIVYLGRVKSLAVLYGSCGVSILIVSSLIFFVPDVPVEVTMTLSLVGKMAITAGFHLIWMFTAELFPTSIRSMAVGQASIFGRFGSISSPYINDILGELVVWAPSLVFGVISLVATGLSLLLPETRRQNMPENIEHKAHKTGGTINEAFTPDPCEGGPMELSKEGGVNTIRTGMKDTAKDA